MFSTFGMGIYLLRRKVGDTDLLIVYAIIGAIILYILIAGTFYFFKLLDKDIYADKIQLNFSKNKNITITTKTKGELPAKDAHHDKDV